MEYAVTTAMMTERAEPHHRDDDDDGDYEQGPLQSVFTTQKKLPRTRELPYLTHIFPRAVFGPIPGRN